MADVNPVVRAMRNAQRARLGLPEVDHDGRDDIDAYIEVGGTVTSNSPAVETDE